MTGLTTGLLLDGLNLQSCGRSSKFHAVPKLHPLHVLPSCLKKNRQRNERAALEAKDAQHIDSDTVLFVSLQKKPLHAQLSLMLAKFSDVPYEMFRFIFVSFHICECKYRAQVFQEQALLTSP